VTQMLQFNHPQTATEAQIAQRDAPSPTETVTSLVQLVHRQLPVIFLSACLATALGMLYLFVTPPSYTAYTTLIIDAKRPPIFQQGPPGGDIAVESAIVASQVEILKSEKIAIAVIEELKLWEDPEFIGPGRGVRGILPQVAGRIFGTETPQTKEALNRRALDVFQDRMTARRIAMTNVLEVGFRSYSPDRAIQVTNSIAGGYISDQLNTRSQSARQTTDWLLGRITELREQSLAAERDVVEFKRINNIVAVAGRSMDEQQLSEVNSQLVVVRAQVAEARARLDRIESVLQSGIPDATVTDTLNNQVVTRLRQQYLDLANREADWSVRYGPDHRAVINLQGQMKEIRNSISDELRRIAETFKSDYEIARQREESVQKAFARVVSQSQLTDQAQITLREKESRAQSARALYENLQQRYMESLQQQSFPISEARLLTQAAGPLYKSHPKSLPILAGMISAGTMLGLLIGIMSEMWRHVFRTRHEVNARLQTSCIAMVPKIRSLVAKPERHVPSAIKSSFGPRTIVSDQGFFWHVLDSPMSRFAESIRSIKLAIDSSDANKSHKIVGLTSALPREGKSTVGTALAQLLSHSGAKTILVDCNFRHSSLSQMLTPNAEKGILEVISGSANLEDVIWTEPYTNLAFLPSVASNRLVNSHEIMTSDAANTLFTKLRSAYDYVIIDLSPLAPIVDARASTQFIDSYILIVEWGKTRVEDVERALTDARAIHENLLGVVLNKANLRTLARYDSRHRNYHSDRYYARHSVSR
jgi:polysaccharide biosynthesis transport protein